MPMVRHQAIRQDAHRTFFECFDNRYRGPDQKDRPGFFGVIEIPVPASLIRKTNRLKIQFADTGGKVSAVSLQRITREPLKPTTGPQDVQK